MLGKVAPTAEQEAYWKAFHEMLEKSSEIVEWKVSRALEGAKSLSVNEDFQKAVAEIRQSYGIEPRIQSKFVEPGAVLHEYTSHLDEAGREKPTLEDIKRTWPQVELRKVEWLRGDGRRTSPRRGRTWRTYERDIYVWRRVKRDGLTV